MNCRNRERGQSANLDGAPARISRAPKGQQGYILLAVLFMVALVLISLSVAAPKVAADIERDREVETIHRGQQYVRAIKLYYKKFGKYPPNLEALEKTNDVRFLRKRYKDPITGKDEWHLLHYGENKTPSYGFFGQPIGGVGGATLAGVGPGGQNSGCGGSSGTFGSSSNSFGSSSNSFGSSSSSFGSSGSSFGSSGSSFGSSSQNCGGTSGTAATNGSGTNSSGTDPNATNSGATTPGTDPNTSSGNSGSATGSGTDSGSGFGTSGNASSGNSGLTVGGLGIIGVESTSPKLAILEWHKKKHFNEWEFWYDPNADRMTISNNTGAIGQPIGSGSNGTSQGGFSQSPGLLNGSGGSSGSSVPSPQQGTQPTPQQP